LRPNSLPAPFYSGESVPTTLHEPNTPPSNHSALSPQSSCEELQTPVSEADEEEDISNMAEIMNLVAANTPSHRGAWRKDSQAWKIFMDKQTNDRDAYGDAEAQMDEDISSDQLGDEYGENFHHVLFYSVSSCPTRLEAI
jgi:hypothetical protein